MKLFNVTFVILMLCALISGCAVYDEKRGIFVSSSIQDVEIETTDTPLGIIGLLPSGAPNELIVGHETRAAIIGGVYVSTNYSYSFGDVDQENLRQSLIKSINAAGLAEMRDIGTVDEAKAFGERKVQIELIRIEIDPGALISTCVIDAFVLLEGSDGKALGRQINIEGNSGFSVAGAKDAAIRKFVLQFASFLKDSA